MKLISRLHPHAPTSPFVFVFSSEHARVIPPYVISRYVTDFPDDELWDHPRCVVIPHLGASTEEAEDAAAAMAAETIMRFLTTGEVVNSVNFPETILEARDAEKTVRVGVVNENTSGVLSKILGVFGDASLNILQQVSEG